MNNKIEEEEDVNLRPVWTSIVWIIALIAAFCFFEAMSLEFKFFDEFCVFTVLFFIALQLYRFRGLIEKKE